MTVNRYLKEPNGDLEVSGWYRRFPVAYFFWLVKSSSCEQLMGHALTSSRLLTIFLRYQRGVLSAEVSTVSRKT